MNQFKTPISFIERYQSWLNGENTDWDCALSYLISENVIKKELIWVKVPAFAKDDLLTRNFIPHCQLHIKNCVCIPLTKYASIYFENNDLIFMDNTLSNMYTFRGAKQKTAKNPLNIVFIVKEDSYHVLRAVLNIEFINCVCVISDSSPSNSYFDKDLSRQVFKRVHSP